ncbi:SUMF1/EgtB/PvdO family nonheme iron enzyme [Nostoc sp.]|uniref:SUMF1/EgtB/PvdO family nonheme iron enzyme n=1 Tax=Nostoc sp. TaxID=1180 RepID=UPI002FF66CBA
MGRNWAIVVGINHYENLRSLNFAKRDASVMATWFQQEARFDQVFLFTDDSPPIATNPPIPTQPTLGHLLRFLGAQFENVQLKPEDNLWFFFAGHGNRYKDKDYLMLSDSDPGNVERTAIDVDYVTQRLRRSGADNVVLFLDACRDESSRGGLGIGEQRHQGVITFYSCTANQKSWEIEELEHGSFTHSLLEGLRLQGEANCATVERLAQHLCYQVPHLNTRYEKPVQNPYLQAEPPYKMYFILLEQTATLRDVEPLKYQASQAENRGDFSLAKQLWVRVLAVSRGDWDAIDAIERIAVRQRVSFEQISPTSESIDSSSGGRSASSEPVQKSFVQKQKEHQQNLVRYEQAFLKEIKRQYLLSEATRSELNQLQQSLQISNDEREQIEQPIIAKKDAENRKRQQEEAQRLQRQQEAERQKQQEVERRRQQQEAARTNSTTPAIITRQKFLQWVSFAGAGLVTAVVGREIFKGQSSTPKSTNQPANKSTTISVAEPKYIPPAEAGSKAFGLPLWTVEFETVTVDEKGQVIKRDPNKQAKFFKEDLGNDITLDMVQILAGSFNMGSPPGEKDRETIEEPQHVVNVPAFFIGKFEVTQEQYQQIMGNNPSNFKGLKRPVEQVSWNDAVDFCNKLSQKTGRKYRLPSEAEWEYACRAGTKTPFYFGETITTELANYKGDSTYASEPQGIDRQETTEVGSFPPNAFGLYDMHGNVWEWCQDTWHDSYKGAPQNGSAWINNDIDYHYLRGGSWLNNPVNCRSACRNCNLRVNLYYNFGFRIVCAAGRTL